MKYLGFWVVLVLFAAALNGNGVQGSNGDRTQFFRNCCENCERLNCSSDGMEIQEQAIKYYQQSIFDKLACNAGSGSMEAFVSPPFVRSMFPITKVFFLALQLLLWTCVDECQYGCMWKTVEAFLERGWAVPQFYGKWPFVRFLGLQEPASVIFSVLNLITHIHMLRKFRREVRRDSPCYKLWHAFSFVCLNGWVWSTVFHARDFPLTELLDYAFAYSMVLVSLYCLTMRMIHKYSLFLRGLVTLIFMSFFVNYFAYLSVGKFSYSFNMATNIVTGIISAAGWFLWCFIVRKRRPYYKKVLRFYVLFGMALSLELLDFTPIYWILDAHALWHFSTIPVIMLFYGFMIDDCKMLRKEKLFQNSNFNKEI